MAPVIKRFYTTVTTLPTDGGWQILLDTRPVRTPARQLLIASTMPMADALVAEWAGQGDVIAPATMRATAMANAAIDLIAPDVQAFAAPLAAYGESDLLCYRAPDADLAAAQSAAWNPILAWAGARFSIEFAVTSGIVHIAQPPSTLSALRTALLAFDPYRLAALAPVISIGGSLIAGLALAHRAISPDVLWDAVTLDERWQEARWGADADAVAVRTARHAEWQASAAFLRYLD